MPRAPAHGLLEALYAVALDTGARRGELFAFEWRDVDLAAGEMHVIPGSGALAAATLDRAIHRLDRPPL